MAHIWRIHLQAEVQRLAQKVDEPAHDKTNKMTVHPAKTQISLGAGYPPSLISFHCLHEEALGP